MWFNPKEQSKFFYHECFKLNSRREKDEKELWKNITDDEYICCYCRYIQDRRELWSKIRSSFWAKEHCIDICNRPEVKRYIQKVEDIYQYCIRIDEYDLTMVRKIRPGKYLFYFYLFKPDPETLNILRYYYRYIRLQLDDSSDRDRFDNIVGHKIEEDNSIDCFHFKVCK